MEGQAAGTPVGREMPGWTTLAPSGTTAVCGHTLARHREDTGQDGGNRGWVDAATLRSHGFCGETGEGQGNSARFLHSLQLSTHLLDVVSFFFFFLQGGSI